MRERLRGSPRATEDFPALQSGASIFDALQATNMQMMSPLLFSYEELGSTGSCAPERPSALRTRAKLRR